MKAVMYFDGGCSPNPGLMKIAVIFKGDINKTYCEKLYQGTNNLAEWYAFLYGLERAIRLGINDLVVYGDSQLVINQFNGAFKVKSNQLKPFYDEAITYQKTFNKLEVKYISRNENSAGIYLERNNT